MARAGFFAHLCACFSRLHKGLQGLQAVGSRRWLLDRRAGVALSPRYVFRRNPSLELGLPNFLGRLPSSRTKVLCHRRRQGSVRRVTRAKQRACNLPPRVKRLRTAVLNCNPLPARRSRLPEPTIGFRLYPPDRLVVACDTSSRLPSRLGVDSPPSEFLGEHLPPSMEVRLAGIQTPAVL